MQTRLFHAVVLAGLAVGSGVAACSSASALDADAGNMSDDVVLDDPEKKDTSSAAKGGGGDASFQDAAHDAAQDVLAEAAWDASLDVGTDAFDAMADHDAGWHTTK